MPLRRALLSSLTVIGLLASAPIAAAADVPLASPSVIAQSGRPPQGGPQGGPPPREAIDACAFSLDGSEINGTCHQPPQGRDNTLLCVPAMAGNG